MIQELYQKAISFAGEKHFGQKVPGTKANYLMHVSDVAMEILIAFQHEPNFSLDLAAPIALLHDTLEDTKTTSKELQNKFGGKITEGVMALTKNKKLPTKQEQMADSLKRIKETFREVKLVKLADRITNLQKPPSYWPVDKIEQYMEEAKLILSELKGENNYLDNRLAQKIEEYSQYLKDKNQPLKTI